jgi:hypothetical protein
MKNSSIAPVLFMAHTLSYPKDKRVVHYIMVRFIIQ